MKVFLTSLAIFDDIGAILIIAFFFTSNISISALIIVTLCIIVLIILNKRGITSKSLYIVIGVVMWIAMLKSGVHATLTGVILAMFIPNKSSIGNEESPLKSLENDLHSAVVFIILPFFAFCNSGISFAGMSINDVFHNITLGIALGLFIGNQVGIFSLCFLTIKLGLAELPKGLTWKSLYGVAILCGIGFTMSLFIGSLAFEETGVNLIFDERLGIIIGSLASSILGYIVLRASLQSNTASS